LKTGLTSVLLNAVTTVFDMEALSVALTPVVVVALVSAAVSG